MEQTCSNCADAAEDCYPDCERSDKCKDWQPIIDTYEHHGTMVKVERRFKGKHREHCLCWKCNHFKPGAQDNCSIAQKLYQVCVDHDLVTPVYECPLFELK